MIEPFPFLTTESLLDALTEPAVILRSSTLNGSEKQDFETIFSNKAYAKTVTPLLESLGPFAGLSVFSVVKTLPPSLLFFCLFDKLLFFFISTYTIRDIGFLFRGTTSTDDSTMVPHYEVVTHRSIHCPIC